MAEQAAFLVLERVRMLASQARDTGSLDPTYPGPDFGAGVSGTMDYATPTDGVSLLYLNYPSNPTAAAAPEGVFADAVEYARRTGAAILHDLAYGDLVFDGRRPASFLAQDGAREVGVELFSMSKIDCGSGSPGTPTTTCVWLDITLAAWSAHLRTRAVS